MKGKKHTEETKKKMSKSGKGRMKSEEHKAKIAAAHRARHQVKKDVIPLPAVDVFNK